MRPQFTEPVLVDFSTLTPRDAYRWLLGAIVPRPIAFISTINAAGAGNLAPFSFFNGVSSNPPSLVVAIARKSNGEKKDTLRNIEETKQFVVNTASRWLLDQIAEAGAEFPYGVDEMQKVGLTPLPSMRVQPPRVKEAAVQIECELSHLFEIGDGSPGSSTLVVGRMLLLHTWNNMLQDGRLSPEAMEPLARLGGISYAGIDQPVTRAIPEV